MRERWIRFYPSELIGVTSHLNAEQRGVYISLLAWTYEQHRPFVWPKDSRHMRFHLGVGSARAVKRLLDELVAEGAITIDADGVILPATYKLARWGRRPASAQERQRIIDRDGAACKQCGATENLAIDHVIPVAQGGRDYPDNLQILCRSCNAKKGPRL